MPCDAQTLISQSNCIQQCVPEALQTPALISIFSQIAQQAIPDTAIDANSLADQSKCIECGIPEGMRLVVLVYLFAQMAMKAGKITATDSQSLTTSAACLECRISNGMNLPILLNLFCQILNAGVFFTNPVTPVTPVCAPAPVIISVNEVSNHTVITWSEAVNPGFGFTIYWGLIPGGPYPNTIGPLSPSVRTFSFANLFTIYIVMTAQNFSTATGCAYSNEMSNFTP